MGKTVKKILLGAAVFLTAGLAIPAVLAAGAPLFLAKALVVVQGLALTQVGLALANPEFDLGDLGRQLAENLSIFSDPAAARAVAFGRTAIAGQVVFRESIENSGDTPDELLMILVLTGYPVTSLEKFWLNGELVFDGDSTTGPGAITSGKFANDLWVWFRTGEETSAAFPDIASLSATWNAKTRVLRGCAAIGVRVKVTEDLEGRLEPLAQIKGSKLYDPRLDSTVPGGSGSHRIDDPSTWEFSTNPALAALAYLIGGEISVSELVVSTDSRYRLDSNRQLDLVGVNTERLQHGVDGLPQGILAERAGTNLFLENRTFNTGWTQTGITFDSTTEADIFGGSAAYEIAESGTGASNHHIHRDLVVAAGDVADNTPVVLAAIVEYVDAQYVSLMFRDKAGAFPIQPFDINPETYQVETPVHGTGQVVSNGIKYLGNNRFWIWASFDSKTGSTVPHGYMQIRSEDNSTSNYDQSLNAVPGRSFILHAMDAFEGLTYPLMHWTNTTTRVSKAADTRSQQNPGISNGFIVDLVFYGRDATRIAGTPAERVLLEYGDLQLLVTDNDVIADIGSGNRVTVNVDIQQDSRYVCAVSKGTDGLFLSVNDEPEASNTGAAFQSAITTGDVYVGSDSAGANHADVPIESFEVA